MDPGRAGAKHSFFIMRIISIVYAREIQEFVLPGCLSCVCPTVSSLSCMLPSCVSSRFRGNYDAELTAYDVPETD